ncbi:MULTISPECIES: hypothetical protein [unclassified Colwellia]|uniref:hypothetical protein n=1 Tax=unclassified Colwellia TaxID=196834 RepID=UPI0015F776FB|nr:MULTISPECIES: hypothetical protein [unclassified Colwellia]MBA6233489.1 hypothetical protein [Colwellia sp. MB02u-7]MBA6236579.1 hypothetical protein [Colwellia sp. MB02u-11]MBA6298022.1 hypothetical protein [Colwellia sp. MB3u-22]MBA6312154.1 hypothetical protein [Colwellia sp. MB3u-64]
MKNVNLAHPFYSFRWLKTLHPDKTFGLRFHPSKTWSKSNLGFTNTSNQYGLKGPCNTKSDTVFISTSYGLGVGVDDGKNWYELSGIYNDSFNISFPVSNFHHNKCLDLQYKGSAKKLIYIYHPNLWFTSLGFYNAHKENLNIFEYYNWKTDYKSFFKIYAKYCIKNLRKLIQGNYKFLYNDVNYRYNTNYVKFNAEESQDFIHQEKKQINNILSRFKDIIVVKIPVKEQLISKLNENKALDSLISNYESSWDIFKNMAMQENVSFVDLTDEFELEDYLPLDTHWSEKGNQKFHSLLKKYLSSEKS